jgi:hypothetical protein
MIWLMMVPLMLVAIAVATVPLAVLSIREHRVREGHATGPTTSRVPVAASNAEPTGVAEEPLAA